MSAIPWMIHNAPLGFTAPAPIRQRARYSFIELVRPDYFDVYTIEQQFGIFRWMVETAAAIEPTKNETGRWGASNPLCLLNMHPTCVNDHAAYPVGSLEGLRKRFHYALLARDVGTSAARWRRENGISVTEQKFLSFPHYAPFSGTPLQGSVWSENGIQKALTGLLSTTGTLTTQLNSCHANATDIHGVVVKVRPQGFEFILHYGIVGEGCRWDHVLAATPSMWEGDGETFRNIRYGRNSETFIGTLDRAITAIAELTKPEVPHA